MTSHPPDEYTQQARSLLERMTPKPYATDVEAVAEALAAAHRRGAEEMRERDTQVLLARATTEQWTADSIRASWVKHEDQPGDAGRIDRAESRAAVLREMAAHLAALPIAALPTGPAAPEGEHAVGDVWENDRLWERAPREVLRVGVRTVLGLDMCTGGTWECTPEDLERWGWRRVRRGGGA